jgi:hypothetical protein
LARESSIARELRKASKKPDQDLNFSQTEIQQEEYHEIEHKGRGRGQVAPSEG